MYCGSFYWVSNHNITFYWLQFLFEANVTVFLMSKCLCEFLITRLTLISGEPQIL